MTSWWGEELSLIRERAAHIAPGLSAAEFDAAEARCGVAFPSDLKELLSEGLPAGKGFPDWRNLTGIEPLLDWPFEGIAFDIEHNSFWWSLWGSRPESLADAIAVARAHVNASPRLIPVYSHRYLPAEPPSPGNPVLSVHQTDIIYYGRDLREYIQNEFGRGRSGSNDAPVRRVRFWSDLIEGCEAAG